MTNIVMLVRGRRRLTLQAIDSLLVNTPEAEFNLTVVHDAKDDDFRVGRLLRGIAKSHYSLLSLESGEHVLSRAKNIGVEWSRQCFGLGDWLYLSDNDVWFGPGWLDTLTQVAQASESGGFALWGGQVHPFHQPVSPASTIWGITEHGMLDGPSWLMRWKTWDKVGGLSGIASGVCKGEDVEFCKKLVSSGGRIGVVHPHCVVHTGMTQTDGRDAPGRAERQQMIPEGVLAE